MTIEVTGCHDCPFCSGISNICEITKVDNGFSIFTQTINTSCPLKQETITIKLKEEKSFNCLYRGENPHPPFC